MLSSPRTGASVLAVNPSLIDFERDPNGTDPQCTAADAAGLRGASGCGHRPRVHAVTDDHLSAATSFPEVAAPMRLSVRGWPDCLPPSKPPRPAPRLSFPSAPPLSGAHL